MNGVARVDARLEEGSLVQFVAREPRREAVVLGKIEIDDAERARVATAGAIGGLVCSSRPGMCRDSVNRNRQICATCEPVVMWTR